MGVLTILILANHQLKCLNILENISAHLSHIISFSQFVTRVTTFSAFLPYENICRLAREGHLKAQPLNHAEAEMNPFPRNVCSHNGRSNNKMQENVLRG